MAFSLVCAGLLVARGLYFLAEVARGRPFRKQRRRSTSVARALVSVALASGFVGGAIRDYEVPSLAVTALGVALFVVAGSVYVWQGWSASPRRPAQPLTQPDHA